MTEFDPYQASEGDPIRQRRIPHRRSRRSSGLSEIRSPSQTTCESWRSRSSEYLVGPLLINVGTFPIPLFCHSVTQRVGISPWGCSQCHGEFIQCFDVLGFFRNLSACAHCFLHAVPNLIMYTLLRLYTWVWPSNHRWGASARKAFKSASGGSGRDNNRFTSVVGGSRLDQESVFPDDTRRLRW